MGAVPDASVLEEALVPLLDVHVDAVLRAVDGHRHPRRHSGRVVGRRTRSVGSQLLQLPGDALGRGVHVVAVLQADLAQAVPARARHHLVDVELHGDLRVARISQGIGRLAAEANADGRLAVGPEEGRNLVGEGRVLLDQRPTGRVRRKAVREHRLDVQVVDDRRVEDIRPVLHLRGGCARERERGSQRQYYSSERRPHQHVYSHLILSLGSCADRPSLAGAGGSPSSRGLEPTSRAPRRRPVETAALACPGVTAPRAPLCASRNEPLANRRRATAKSPIHTHRYARIVPGYLSGSSALSTR